MALQYTTEAQEALLGTVVLKGKPAVLTYEELGAFEAEAFDFVYTGIGALCWLLVIGWLALATAVPFYLQARTFNATAAPFQRASESHE